MPRESAKNRLWEKDRRNRLNDAFIILGKVLPDYDPSIKESKIEVLQKAAAFIEDLQKKIDEFINAKTSDKPQGDIVKKLQDRVKKLLNRNEQLTLLLQNAGVTVPAVFRTVKKFRCPMWSNKISPEQAKIIQAQQEKENVLGNKKPRKSNKVACKSGQTTPKPRKLPSNTKRKVGKSKKRKGNVMMLSKNFIVVQPPVVSQSCYVVTNPTPVANIIKTTAPVLAQTTSSYITTTLVQPVVKPIVKSNVLPSLGPRTLIFTDYRPLPVLTQIPQIPPMPQIITNPIPLSAPINPTLIVLPKTTTVKQVTAQTVLTDSTKIKVNNKEAKPILTKARNGPRLLPKRCLTTTTQICKVPIPALTSRYADCTFPSSSNHINGSGTNLNTDKVTANKSIRKVETTCEKPTENKSQKGQICGHTSNKRCNEEKESSIPAKVTKLIGENIEDNKNIEGRSQGTEPLVNLIDSVCIKEANIEKTAQNIEKKSNTSQNNEKLESSNEKDDSAEKRHQMEEVKTIDDDALTAKDTVDTTQIDKKNTNTVIDVSQKSASDLVVDSNQQINQNSAEVGEKTQNTEESNKSQNPDDLAQDILNDKLNETILNEKLNETILNEKLNETITQLVPSMTTSVTENYRSDAHYGKTQESNIDKDAQETTQKPEDIANDIKTLEMNLGHSELSNDIFASLQVPAGCQNPESTSPTAAFLLAFPLVSSLTGVKVTEVMDDENTESQSGTPTLLQIGTMDSTKPTQSQSDSLTPSLLNLDNLSFFNTKDICSSFYTPFDNIPVSSVGSSNIVSATTTTISMMTACETNKIVTNKNHQAQVMETDLTRKHMNLVSHPVKHNASLLSGEKTNCASNTSDNTKNNINVTTNNTISSVARANITSAMSKTSFNVPENKIHYQEKVRGVSNNQHLSTVGDNLNGGNKISSNDLNRAVPNREALHNFPNLNVGNNNVNSVFNSLYERNNVHIPPYERNNAFIPTSNTMVPSINTVLSTNSTPMSTSKSAVLPTNVSAETLPHNLQGSYQHSKPKPNDIRLKNSELKLCMNFTQNPQQNKSFNNAHYTNFPPLDTDKLLNTTCAYNQISKSFMDPIYTNSNTYNSYSSEQNNAYYKKPENRNYYNATYQNYEECRKNENITQFTNNYYHHSQSYNVKEKYSNNTGNITNKSQQNGAQGAANQITANQVRPPINWMTTPDNRQNTTEYVMPIFSKDNTFTSSANYPTNSFISNNQTTYFNSNPVYSNSDIMSDTRKPLDLPLVSVNSYQRTDVEENQFPWSPTKLPQFLEPPTFVSSTLTNLIGDLALGNPNTFLDQKCDGKFTRDTIRNKENVKRAKTNTSYESQTNFLSVSQLVEHNKGESAPARLTSRRNSGPNRQASKTSQSKVSKRNTKVQDNKDMNQHYGHHKNMEHNSTPKSNQMKSFNAQANEMFCGANVNTASTNNSNNNNNNSHSSNTANNNMNQPNKNGNMNKNVPSSYSAEALIGHQTHQIPNDNLQHKTLNMQQNYTPTTKSSLPVPSFLPENIISYFPPVDIPQDNSFNQNQNYQPASFSHNFTTTFQNNTYNNNFIPPVSTITNNYLPTNNFMHDVSSHDYLSENLNLFPTAKDSKHYTKNSNKNNTNTGGNNREDKTVQSSTSCSNYKKTKRKQVPESTTVPNFVDFPFLTVPGAINSPILPDDFHTHSSFLPPPTPSQLYPCKNPLYPKQSTELTAGSLLPLPPPVPVTRSSIQHPEISPSINTGGTSLTNFNLSTIFPEINKSPLNGVYNETKSKEHATRTYTTSGSQVSFNNKSTFSLSYINCPTTQYNQ